jgi:N-acetylated-alpha-linked acidic dipeptidase
MFMSVAIRASLVLLGAASLTVAVVSNAVSAETPGILGFTANRAAEQRQLEQSFDAQLNAAEMRDWLKRLSSAPNNVGSPHDKANAEFIRDQLKSFGWDVQIEAFEVLYPTLKSHRLELLGPKKFVASLREPPVSSDATSTQRGGVPQFNTYGGDGDVTAELVYVNYGMPDDYKELARFGIDVKGKIVITRYGGGWRGLKPKLAQEHGAVGCIIYSDPREDGFFVGDSYPNGGWRPASGAQRGSVLDMPVVAGDPLTPGVGATKDAKRITRADAKTILKIPVLPISYADAQPLLAALSGPVAPASWRGALPITYHLGAGPAKVRLAVFSNWDMHTIYDVIAKIPGSETPDEWVIRGNHHDAWVFGASDPLSGTITLLAEAQAIGALLKTGWKPKRTLLYASWDAEEPGLIGSTEWAETHAEELQRKAVLYLNSDSNARGFLAAGGSHALQRLVNEVAQNVQDPEMHVSVRERLKARTMVRAYERGANEELKAAAKKVAEGGDLPIGALGSGSDFSPFLQHLGLATLSISYGGEDEENGSYHSNYDSFDHFVRFGDPTFSYGVAQAQTVGRIVLRVANADVLPMQFGALADTVSGYVQELHKLADDKRRSTEDLARLLDQKAFVLANDPTKIVLPPAREPEVPYLDFSSLDNAAARMKKSAKAYDDAYNSNAAALSDAQRKELNSLLRGLEQTFTVPQGLPRRDWYKHLIYAPGLLTGYGVKTVPGVREAIDDNQWNEANQYTAITARAIENYAARLDQATMVLKRGR